MFLKLLRHEIKETWRDLLLIEGATALVLVSILAVGFTKSVLLTAIANNFSGAVSMVGAMVVWGWMVVRYYRTVYGNTGYFTASLPMPAWSIWAAKTLWALVVVTAADLVAVVESQIGGLVLYRVHMGNWGSIQLDGQTLALILVWAIALLVSLVAAINISRSVIFAHLNPVLSLVIVAVGIWFITQIVSMVFTLIVPLAMTISLDPTTGSSTIEGFSWHYVSISHLLDAVKAQQLGMPTGLTLDFPAGALIGQGLLLIVMAWGSVWLLDKHYSLP